MTLSVLGATTVSFLVAAFLLKTDKATDEPDLAAATASMESMKGKKSSVASALVGAGDGSTGPIKSIVFACDAGMGSSAMGASVLRRKIQQAGFGDVKVTNSAISNLTDTYDLVVSHRDLTARASQKTGSAIHVSVDDFMSSPRYDEIVEQLKASNGGGVATAVMEEDAETPSDTDADVLPLSSIVMNGSATSTADAINEAGQLLVVAGAVEPAYVDAMHERESSISTYMGNGLAIPHGTNEAKDAIRRTGLSFVRYAEPVDWNGKPAEFVVGIAGAGKDHMALLTKIAQVFLKADEVTRLREATTAEEVRSILMGAQK